MTKKTHKKPFYHPLIKTEKICLELEKTGLQGEEYKEVLEALEDLASIECDIINIGQYVKPSKQHTEVVEWIHPYIFQKYKKDAYELGFLHVESEPYARISFHAAEFVKKIGRKK